MDAEVKGAITPVDGSQKCVGLIQAGSERAREELIFLRAILLMALAPRPGSTAL